MSYVLHCLRSGEFIRFQEEKRALTVLFSEEQCVINGVEYASKQEAVGAIFDTCQKMQLLRALWGHFTEHPRKYVQLNHNHECAIRLFDFYFSECACTSGYNRFQSSMRSALERRIVEMCRTHFAYHDTLSLLLLGSGGMLDSIFLLSRLIHQGFRHIKVISVDPYEREMIAEMSQRFFKAYMPEVVDYQHVDSISEVGESVSVLYSGDADFLGFAESIDVCSQAQNLVEDRGFSCLSAYERNCFVRPGGLEFYAPLRAPFIDWKQLYPRIKWNVEGRGVRILASQEVALFSHIFYDLSCVLQLPVELSCLSSQGRFDACNLNKNFFYRSGRVVVQSADQLQGRADLCMMSQCTFNAVDQGVIGEMSHQLCLVELTACQTAFTAVKLLRKMIAK